jgi:hypothetical protein
MDKYMQAELKHIHSPDALSLATYSPENPEFSLLLQLIVGPIDADGAESFDVLVSSFAWVAAECDKHYSVDGRHHLIIAQFDCSKIENYFRNKVQSLHGNNWQELTVQLSRIGKWEFEDYRS